jgi:excinuclease ABC subunit A
MRSGGFGSSALCDNDASVEWNVALGRSVCSVCGLLTNPKVATRPAGAQPFPSFATPLAEQIRTPLSNKAPADERQALLEAARKRRGSGYIRVEGARVHNLRNVHVDIPRGKLTVITGLSGSGKSSLAFDTLYAEGQRRYVESLSSYARQFLGRLEKPDVDRILGISPAIAIEQKVVGTNPRSTVGSMTEIQDHLKLLFARIGRTISPVSGQEVRCDTAQEVAAVAHSLPAGTTILVLCPLHLPAGRTLEQHLDVLQQQGFARVHNGQQVMRIEELLAAKKAPKDTYALLVDRVVTDPEDEDLLARLTDSAETAFFEGQGACMLAITGPDGSVHERHFSDRFERDGIAFERPSTELFSVNSPLGACKRCEGFGNVIGIDEHLVVPDRSLSVYDDAVACWKGEKLSEYKERFIAKSSKLDFPIHRPYSDLTSAERALLWHGTKQVPGIDQFFSYCEEKSYKIQYRVLISRYRGKTTCKVCHGTRLRPEAEYVKVGERSFSEIMRMPVRDALHWVEHLDLSPQHQAVAQRLLKEMTARLRYLVDVGVGYLALERRSNTLSGGETQRIDLATSLGSSLVGSMYILDEPSIGLHPRDTDRLITILHKLRDLGNTVIVVEHDEAVMRAADHIIDMGPLAGDLGGEVVFSGTHNELMASDSLTARYLTGRESIPAPTFRHKPKDRIVVRGAQENNLKDIDVAFPLHMLTVVTGVSGSGKTTLVKRVLYPAIKRELEAFGDRPGAHRALEGDLERIKAVELVDQRPIGRSSRSNPVTYVKAWDEIRQLFSEQELAKARGYRPAFFSFNVEGGRCETCQGEGEVHIEMQFMADVGLRCDACHGRRFKDELLDVQLLGKNVSQVLEMTVDEAIAFFSQGSATQSAYARILQRLLPLQATGLGYVQLGQSSSTLSGGEAQRIKLSSFLTKGQAEQPTLFIFDEPTTGLHFQDITKLLAAFRALVANGHSLIVIEHNPDVVRNADHVIDLGPDGGEAGGQVVFEGTPEGLMDCQASLTGQALAAKR